MMPSALTADRKRRFPLSLLKTDLSIAETVIENASQEGIKPSIGLRLT